MHAARCEVPAERFGLTPERRRALAASMGNEEGKADRHSKHHRHEGKERQTGEYRKFGHGISERYSG